MKNFGNGLNDDTDAIQAKLDSGVSTVYLPPPADHYVISRTLRIHSNQSLALDRFTRIRLAPKSDCLMVCNADPDKGDCNISVIGGVWDMDNRGQSPNPIMTQLDQGPQEYRHERYLGVCMRMLNVENLTLRSLTFRDPVTFCTQLAKLRHFTVEDILFDYRHFNPIAANMDGIHLDGNCRFGRIANLKGATNDDLVAINADDNEVESPCFGPIEDVTIDGIYAEHCHSAVRLLSSGSAVRRITIRNIHGTFYRYAVGFTKFFFRRPGTGHFDSIVLENLHCSKSATMPEDRRNEVKPDLPLVYIERDTHVRRLAIRDFHREETDNDTASIHVQRGAKVDWLLAESCSLANRMDRKIDFLRNEGAIGTLFISGFNGQSRHGGGMIVNEGVLENVDVRMVDLAGMERGAFASLPPELRGGEGLVDMPVPSGKFAACGAARLVEDAEADAGQAFELEGLAEAAPLSLQCQTRGGGKAWTLQVPSLDITEGEYALYDLGSHDLFYHDEELRMRFGCDRASAICGPLHLPADRYRIWARIRCDRGPDGGRMLRISRVIVEPLSPWRNANVLLNIADAWRFRVDPENKGTVERWWNPAGPAAGAWSPIDISRRWTDQGHNYHGLAWYRADFDLPQVPEGRKLWLAFGAVDGAAEVWINGKRAGCQMNVEDMWCRPWALDVTGVLHKGKNALAVAVKKEKYDAGIYKPVELRLETE